ncbi:MAG TPA: TIR domain-containing protein [Umezawaea sp.]|nr:TIR domain-containing protein [Umezawaea sp.]
MKRVFLSYAKEDVEAAEQLATWLREKDVEVFWWQDPAQRGGRIRGVLEEQLRIADHFFALMSEHYLASRWCQLECDVAIGRDDMVIKVIQVGGGEPSQAGFLGIYDWLSPDHRKLSAALDFDSGNGRREPPPFQNRDDELAQVKNALRTSGGQDLWVVFSPPRMGKSWFLQRLRTEVESSWEQVKVLDLRQEPADLRIDPARLLNALLGVTVEPSADRTLTQEARLDIARQVRKRRRTQLYLLDSADLLDRSCAAELRSALFQVHRMIGPTTNGDRFGVVVGTRRHSDWRGVTNGRFEPVALSEFTVSTVRKTIEGYGRTRNDDEAAACATLLHGTSEGLPALLTSWLMWAKDKDFLGLTEAECARHFHEVVDPYVKNDLLAVESLVPAYGVDLARTSTIIEHALRVLVVYRVFTRSHLNSRLETDEQFGREIRQAGWSVDGLWEAVSNTSLIEQNTDLWRCVNPPIRRLLYRYYYRTDGDRATANADAQRFYRGWIEKAAGLEQPKVMLECLWHETSRLLAERPHSLGDTLPGLAAQLASEFITSTMYGRAEMGQFLEATLRDDTELLHALSGYEGLHDQVLASIIASISEDRS